MSSVTDIILISMINDGSNGQDKSKHPNADIISNYIRQNHHDCELVKVDPYAGDKKNMQCDIFMCTTDGLDTAGLIELFNSIKWQDPDCVQLMLKDEQDDAFLIHSPVQIYSQ
ncbi:hypothetical protein [Amphritea sp. HPY]|uniref:hypothetical protein n=1 Tax=Amphritea sp. HPY TaxID=3421652 RepID=UPI003D7DF966